MIGGLSSPKKDQIAERGPRAARRDDRGYREYLSEEQRRGAGCPAREVVILRRGQATSAIRRSSSCVVAAIVVASFAVHTGRAQPWSPPRTPWGDPDFQGIWNYATMTPLERPRDIAEKEAFTADEAAAYEQRTNERQGRVDVDRSAAHQPRGHEPS